MGIRDLFNKIIDSIRQYDRRTVRLVAIGGTSVVILIVVLCIYAASTSHIDVRYSTPGQIGNTAGNLYNRGLFCEHNGRIYFSNNNDDGLFYSMGVALTDFKKLYNDKVQYINVDENYVYYSRINNLKAAPETSIFTFYSNGIFRYDPANGTTNVLSAKPLGSLLLYDNKLFFQHYSSSADPLRICCVDIEGNNEYVLFTDDSVAVCAVDGRIYYADTLNDHFLHSISTDGRDELLELGESVYMPIVTEDGFYYISPLNKYRIYHQDYDGNKECIIRDRCCTYNISKDGRFIYYQKDGGEDNGMFVYDSETGESTRVISGNFKWFNVVAGYCFFYDYNGDHVYVYTYDGQLSEFKPPVIAQ